MSFIETQGNFDSSFSLLMMETCSPVSSNNFDGLLLNIKLTVDLSPTNSAKALLMLLNKYLN